MFLELLDFLFELRLCQDFTDFQPKDSELFYLELQHVYQDVLSQKYMNIFIHLYYSNKRTLLSKCPQYNKQSFKQMRGDL